MRHCRHCRADAIGLLGEDRSAEFANITCCAEGRPAMTAMTSAGTDEMRVAVATTDGRTVNEHFGMAETFRTYSVKDGKVLEIGRVEVAEQQGDIPLFGPGHRTKLERTVELLSGNDVVISKGSGSLRSRSLRSVEMLAVVDNGEVTPAIIKAVKAVPERADH